MPALCLATPDGLPLLGYHPGFERGRVAVACTVSAASASLSTSEAPGSGNASPSPPAPHLRTSAALGDGYQLVPLVAKAAADLLLTGSMSLTAVSSALWAPTTSRFPAEDLGAGGMGMASAGERSRGGVHLGGSKAGSSSVESNAEGWKGNLAASAVLAARGVDSWGGLGRLQDGSVQRFRSREDLEREADQREDLRRSQAA